MTTFMRIAFSLLLTLHAVIHMMGFAKAFGLASPAQLRVPISRPMGMLWLVAAVLLLAAVAALFTAPRWFWLIGALGLAASQTAIIASWSDARFGTVVNVVLLATVIYAAFAWGPFGLRAEYERLVQSGLAQTMAGARPHDITETDLAVLPPLVQRYLRFAGVVGTPRVQGFRARLTGRIRGSATAPWMPFRAEQHNFYDPPPPLFLDGDDPRRPAGCWSARLRRNRCEHADSPAFACARRRSRRNRHDADRDGHDFQRPVPPRPGEPPRSGDPLARDRRAQRGKK